MMGVFNGGRQAVPARFDGASQARRAMLGKVHIAKKQLGLTDDDYVAVLLRVTTRTSAADCSDAELVRLVEEFKRLGFSAQARAPGRAKPADHPVARKARALWISLHHLNAIANPSEAALEAFARRQLKCATMQWANQALGYRLIEALKAIATRNGWDQAIEGVAPAAALRVLKLRLVDAIAAKLVAARAMPADWGIERAAFEFAGLRVESARFADVQELDLIAKALGDALRKVTP